MTCVTSRSTNHFSDLFLAALWAAGVAPRQKHVQRPTPGARNIVSSFGFAAFLFFALKCPRTLSEHKSQGRRKQISRYDKSPHTQWT